jgi:hypothetical protein
VFLTAAPIFPATFDFDLFKIVYENPPVIPHEGFQRAGFSEILICTVRCAVFGWWQWHLFDYVLGELSFAGALFDHHFGLTH